MIMAGLKISSVFRHGLFKDKVAIVTGGATGIGKTIASELLYLGCKVVIASRKEDRLIKAAEELNQLFPKAIGSRINSPENCKAFVCNIRKQEQVDNLVNKALSSYGTIDFLVNNGGGQFMSPLENMSQKGWEAVIDTNLNGTFSMCRTVFDLWMKDHGGAIVNIIAEMSRGFPNMAHTGAARAAVENLCKSMSVEWAHYGVRVNCVAPGYIYSPSAAANYGLEESDFDQIGLRTPAKRIGRTEEISSAVCFLLGPSAAFITGSTVSVDGGGSLYPSPTWEVPDHSKLPPYKWEDDVNAAENLKSNL